MQQKVLVAIRAQYQVNDTLSCLKEVMKPGMKAVFLLPYSGPAWRYLRDHWVEAETGRAAMSAGKQILASYSWAAQMALAKEKLSSISVDLQKRGIDFEIQLYTGSLRKVLQGHLAQGDVYWVLTRARTCDLLAGLAAGGFAPFGWLKRRRNSSVWLLHPVTMHE